MATFPTNSKTQNTPLSRLIQQAKLQSFQTSPKFKYGYEIPCNHKHAMKLEKIAGDHKWATANKLEHKQLIQIHNFFKDIDTYQSQKVPPGYKRIKTQMVYDIKHDLQHKVRAVTRGDL